MKLVFDLSKGEDVSRDGVAREIVGILDWQLFELQSHQQVTGTNQNFAYCERAPALMHEPKSGEKEGHGCIRMLGVKGVVIWQRAEGLHVADATCVSRAMP